jgi:hypothetical protein
MVASQQRRWLTLAKVGYVDAGFGADRMKRRFGKARSDDEADRMTYPRLVSSSVE